MSDETKIYYPTVSIVIPIKNRVELFSTTLDSLQAQTVSSWEAILVDDSSCPRERTKLKSLAERDSRTHLLDNRGPVYGACPSRNLGLLSSRGEFVLFLDADDALAPDCLQKRLQILQTNPNLDFVVAPVVVFTASPGDSNLMWNIFNEEDDLDRFTAGDSPWNTNSVLWRRSSIDRIKLRWRETSRSWQDWDFHLRALAAGLTYFRLPEPDCYWRRPTNLGSIGSNANSPIKAVNRARTLRDVIQVLVSFRKLTTVRRKNLGYLFYQQAFKSRQKHSVMLKIWKTARQNGAVSAGEFWAVLLIEMMTRGVRRITIKGFIRIFPSAAYANNYFRHSRSSCGHQKR